MHFKHFPCYAFPFSMGTLPTNSLNSLRFALLLSRAEVFMALFLLSPEILNAGCVLAMAESAPVSALLQGPLC